THLWDVNQHINASRFRNRADLAEFANFHVLSFALPQQIPRGAGWPASNSLGDPQNIVLVLESRGSLAIYRGHPHAPYLLNQPTTLKYVPHVLQMNSYVIASHEDRDPVNNLNNYVRGHPDGNLAPYLTWNIRRVDPSDETTYHVGVTYRFKGDKIGYGRGPSIDAAKKEAAIEALLCLRLTSIRDDFYVSTKTKES
ncbi:hypothetical protein H4582DRAFT_1970333, partial [Lactarius indigo]